MQNSSFFGKAFEVAELYSKFDSQNLNVKIITLFSDVSHNQITAEALTNCLTYSDINFEKIYNDNKEIIDAIKELSNEKIKKDELDKLITNNTDFNEIYRYILSQSTITICENILEHYGQNINKELLIYSLVNLISFTPSKEKLITYSVIQGKLTNEELNKILIDFVKRFVSKESSTTKEKIDQFDYFLRLYEHKITEETKDELMHLAVFYINFINKPFLAKMVN